MIKIRLARKGSRNNLFFRIVASETRSKREGKPLAVIGYWSPRSASLKINKDKLGYWQERGAKISLAVKNLMSKAKIK